MPTTSVSLLERLRQPAAQEAWARFVVIVLAPVESPGMTARAAGTNLAAAHTTGAGVDGQPRSRPSPGTKRPVRRM